MNDNFLGDNNNIIDNQNPNPNQIRNNNNLQNIPNQNEYDININLRKDRDFFIPITSLAAEFGMENPYYSFHTVDPLKESFFHILQSLIFPNLTPFQISSILCYIIIIVFILLLSIGGIDEINETQFLPVKFSIIEKIGGFYPFEMKKNYIEFYRLFTFHFIHLNFSHLAFNILSLVTFCSLFEVLIKKYIFILVFLGSGIFGNITSSCFFNEKEKSCGINGGVSGLYGGFCTLFFINWKELIPVFGEFGRFITIYLLSVFMFLSVCYYHFNEYGNILVQFFCCVYGGLIFAVLTRPIVPARHSKLNRTICGLIILVAVALSFANFILKK